MSPQHEPGAGGPHHDRRRRQASRRWNALRQRRQAFQPDFHDLERRMMPSTFTVNTTADSGAGSLRQAITDSNATPGSNTIDFGIGAVASQQTIALASPLPAITDPVLIDGWSQGGASYIGAPLVQIDGTSAGSGADGLDFAAGSDGSTARGLVVSDFAVDGILVQSNDNLVEGCYIGLNAAGTAAIANRSDGVEIDSGASGNTIGGTAAGAANVISGNDNEGVEINGSGTSGNLVAGNLIGTNAAGTAAIANRNNGVEIDNGASGNTIGGTTAGAGNLISGNVVDGVFVLAASGNRIAGNRIGTDTTGSTALGNGYDGVELDSSSNDTVGGTTATARDVISANGQFNVYLVDSSGETVQGNYLGTDATGGFALDTNTYVGVDVLSSSDNLIGGTAAGAGNVVSGHAFAGINVGDYAFVNADTTVGNIIQGNLVGLDASGTIAVPNDVAGIEVGPAEDTEIGGTAVGAGNIIAGTQTVSFPDDDSPAGSDGAGILVDGPAPGTVIQDNRIGTNESGTAALPNQGTGVFLQNDTATISGNQISGNGYDGITVWGTGTPNGLSGLWTADGTTGDGNGSDGTLLAGATYAPGLSGQAFSFNGLSGAFRDDTNFTPPQGRIDYGSGATMEAWIKTTATSGTLITDGGGIDTQSGMGLFLQNGQLVAIGSKGTAGQFNFELTSPGTINDGQWHLVAVTWDGTTSADGVTLYVDGVAVATGTALATFGNSASSVLYFGGDPKLPLPYYQGLIDEVGVYSLPLSASDIATIYSLRGVAQLTSAAAITGNLIGTNAAGTAALGNGNDGVDLVGSSFNTIGGTTAAAGNVISGNTLDGVSISGSAATGNVVAGNVIGTNIDGSAALANGRDGVEIDAGSTGNTIGGTVAVARNVISGNTIFGVRIRDSGTSGNLVEGNLIGTNSAGTGALPNQTGLQIELGPVDNTVGGTAAGAGNVIAGNTNIGVYFFGAGTSDNVVEGNLIGTDITGTIAIGNGVGVGVEIYNSSDNTIGGTAARVRNVISGNVDGISIDYSAATGNVVEGNLIGTDITGKLALGNSSAGVSIQEASDNTIGGTIAGSRNVISKSGSSGIYIQGAGASGNVVEGDLIGTDITGTVALGNRGDGVTINEAATDNTIGGGTTAVANVISGNTGYGIQVDGAATLGNILANNWVGTGAAGIGALPNAGGALEITSGAAVLARGAFSGNVVNQGTLGLWDDATGVIAITGNYTQGSSGTLDVNLGGTARSEYDQLEVSGTATLAGTLGVILIDGLSIGPFEDYQLLSYGTLAGSFATIQYPSGVALYASYGPSSLDLLSTPSFELVTNTTDAGTGSLRAAILTADAAGNPNPIWIAFNISADDPGYSGGAWTIAPASALPAITAPVILDGTTQPGFAGAPIVVLAGTSAGASASGLTIAAGASGSTIRGLVIDDFGQDGISVQGSGITIAGSEIGVDATGRTAKGNAVGIDVSVNNTIGGTAAGSGNVISGNTGDGVDLDGAGATGDVVAGNWIGTNAVGSIALANALAGVALTSGASDNVVGPANVISGNAGDGVDLNGGTTTGNVVQGNFIGTDATGEFAIGNAGAGVNDVGAPDNTIGGSAGGARNVLSGNAEGVIVIGPATGFLVAGNLIGTDATGTAAIGNATAGVVVSSTPGVTIGGPTAVARNVISGNRGDGVDVEGNSADTLLQGNYVGVDQTGTQSLGNAGDGISIDLSPGATIGGTASGAGNVISANAKAGVSIQGSATFGAAVLGNFIGTNKTGSIALGNGADGVDLGGMSDVTIGGAATGSGNVISANAGAGVGLVASDTGELVQGNRIGTDITGSNPLGNGTGIIIEGGSSNNTIGGTTAGAGNTIAYSATIGVDVVAGTGNEIRWNSVFSDGGLGIAVASPVVQYPVLTAVSSGGGTTTVIGTFAGAANATFALDFYTMSSINPSGYGEGRYVLGSAPVTTDASGNASFSFTFPTPTHGADFVSATATDPNGNTSEFSHDSGKDTPPTAVMNYTMLTVDEGVAVPFDGTHSLDPQGSPLTYTWSFGDGGTATGATPIYTYRSVGTFTVMLTVNDGFGGISTATATITVNDVPPAFVPRAFTPPVTFAAPSPGDGFGASVASVAGDAAIGAPFDDGPSSSLHPGAVFLYDGVPTDDGITTNYAYGALIHVFADPNPQAGDEFGAAIATVGTDLLIGAPGSSLTGPGDGAAYLFDADPSSPTFGALLSTFTLPDPDAAHQAHFGAAVAAANTNAVIGAPGKTSGSGEVFVYAGDPMQLNFGSLLLDISNPHPAAGSDFGAALAGLGGDVIVGAPFAATPGTGTGVVYLFSGTAGAPLAAIDNAGTSAGFGSAVGSVGANILIGSPEDNAGAGAAFLFSPSDALLQTFVQPDGGGGQFGASVAGSGTTALIGAPGATLGTSDAGAAYLFDANPSSSIFGQPIAAEQEPTPVTGDDFGGAVGFLDVDGALLIGAEGAGGSGAEAADLYQPGAPLSVSATTTYATGAPYDSVIVSGTFVVPGNFDTLTGSIDWGDGSAPTLMTLPPGSYAFSVPHDYSSASAARYAIGVTLSDALGETAFAQAVVLMSDPAPAFAAPGLVLSSSSINENGSVTVSGTILSPGGTYTNTVAIDWGDGSTQTTIVLPPGVYAFSTPHTYLNNPAGEASGNYTISAQVTDEEYKLGQASTTVAVSNVPPQFTAADLNLSESTATEGDTVTLNGQFTDPGTLDPHTVTIDWGDGSPATVLRDLFGQVVASTTTPGLFTYSAQHQYLNNPPGEPTGGTYDIHVSVSDDVSTSSADRYLVVNNAAPTVRIQSAGSVASGSTISLTASVTDLGVLDTETLAWTLTQNGTLIATGTGPDFSFTTPNPVGVLVATATATDSDGGTGSDSSQIVLILQGNATATITTSAITITQGANTVGSTPTAGADRIIGLVYGSDDVVDASSLPATTDVELDGYGSNETLIGGAGDDQLLANSGGNSLVGGPGNDTLVSNRGDDSLYGGAGNDVYRINPGPDPLAVDPSGFNTLDFSIASQAITLSLALNTGQAQSVDSSGDVVSLDGSFDAYIGSPYGNDVTGNDDNDLIYGGAGNNTITGGDGNNSIVGGTGNDIIYGGNGNSTITGGGGGNSIVGGTGNDIIYGGLGTATITGGGGSSTIVGGTGNDIIYGGSVSGTMTGGSGSVSIVGGTGNDIIYGGNGNSTITGGSGGNSIVGGTGNDIIYGGYGNSTITGGGGDTTIVGGTGNDIIYGGSVSGTMTGGSGSVSIVGGTGNDIIYGGYGTNTITGGSGNDSIVGGTGNDIIYGGYGNSTITGGGGDTTIVGGTGNDIIYGGSGSGTMTGGSGSVSIVGGTGNDIIYGGYGTNTITGGSGNDSIVGGTGNDIIYGGYGNSTITGGGGDTTIVGGTGNDIIYGGSGSGTMTGGSGSVSIVGGTGNDIIYGGYGTNTITGGSGNDTIVGGTGNDIIYGGYGNCSITGGNGDTSIVGGTGNDIIYGGYGTNTITGGSGNDTIVGGTGNDIIYGGLGNCSITGGGGSDSIVGGTGNDIIYGGNGNSTITGGGGNDSIVGGTGNDIIYGGYGNDTITGGGGNDSIVGGTGNDIIYGGSGDDTLAGGTGNATISGGGGSDTITAAGFDSWLMLYGSMNMTLTNTTLSTSGGGTSAATSTIAGFQHAILAAGPGDFTLDASGFSGSTLLLASTGDDTLIGSTGGDTLVGGAGNDSLVGGGGADTFAFNGGSSGSDVVDEPAGTNVATLDFSNAPDGISIDLGQTGPQAVIPGTLTLTLSDPMGISNVLGSPYDDTIIGNARDNTLVGVGGQDLIAGLGGNDVLQGDITRTVLLDFDTDTTPGDHIYTQDERNLIQAELTADYSAFSYTFTPTPPSSGPYTTIDFNDPTLTGLEGGAATGIDWRDLDITGTTTLTAAGLQVTPADTASVNVANLLGQAGEPAATSADFVALSVTIAAHELGHLSGLEHGDSYGPIGSGIYVGVSPDLYSPPFPGPTDADETIRHIMASGASVNETLFQAIDDPFFGEREAIKLAFGEDGTPVIEQSAPHYAMADAQPIELAPLVVPDTDLEGANADQVFDVTAADVIGEMNVGAGGSLNTDYYSFTAQAGTVINIQVMSEVLDRPQGWFDATVTVYDASGNVIAYNDDSFQDYDSTIIDLTLPSTGTYYVEVTPSTKLLAPGEPLSDDTGAYELFLYTFATNGDPPAGDTMYGGSGQDTIVGGPADDTITAPNPSDTIIYGSGIMTQLSNAPYLDVSVSPSPGSSLTVNEGMPVTLTGSFLDPDDGDLHSYDWHVVSTSGQPIADGTGPSFTFSPGNAGSYTVTYTVLDQNGGGASAKVVVTSNAVQPVLTAPTPAQNGNVVEGECASIDLGTLAAAGIGPWTVTVQWGDGQSSTFSTSSIGLLFDGHTYAAPGSYTICEMVSESFGETTSIDFPITVVPSVTATALTPATLSAVYGQSTTVTATVTGYGTPTGTVALYLGAVNPTDQIATGMLSVVDGQDEVTFTVSGLDVSGSPYQLTAVYDGDASHQCSTSQAASLTINPDATTVTASAAGGAFGQSITISATVAPSAPGTGTPTGTVAFSDTTTGDSLGTVTLSGGKASLTTSSLPPGSQTIEASYSGDSNFLASSGSTSVITISQSIIVLDPSAGAALSLSGSASINVAGGVFVDSSSSSALSASGAPSIKAAVIDVHGGVAKSGSPSFSPTPVTGAAAVADPLASLPLPSTTGLTNYGAENLAGASSATIKPGIYSAINVSGSASLTLSSGTYIIEGGGFSVSGAANVTGSGVTIVNAGSKYPSTGGSYASITLSGSGSYKLTPPTTGTYAGIVIFQTRDNTKALTVSGAASGMTGTIYAPAAQLAESGSGSLNAALIVDTLTLSGAAVSNAATLDTPTGTIAYTPAQIRAAYGISSLDLDGTGQTIAIVDAYDDPMIGQALDAFDAQFGLTASGPSLYAQYGPASSFLTVLNQSGQTTSLPSTDPSGPGTDNWEVEEALDVEWAHAIAPGAQIVLVEASSQSLSDLRAGVATAASQPGVSVVSMSWGFPEGQAVFGADEAGYDGVFNVPGVTFVASTGDYGAADPEYPAFSPNVVAVGGTSLAINADGSYNSETGWGYSSEAAGGFIGSGGGLSLYEPEPTYQQGVQSTGSRTTPDVSLVADPATGAWIADPYNLTGSDPFEVVGGTSLSAPAWAGLLALVNQRRVAESESTLNGSGPTETQQALYSLPQADYNVIDSGSNGYSALAGYNLVTGLGTPVANVLIPDLAAYAGPGTSYAGPTVGPLQDATLTVSGSNGGGSFDAFSVVDAFIVPGTGLGDVSATGAGNAPGSPTVGGKATPAGPTVVNFPGDADHPMAAGLAELTPQPGFTAARGGSGLDSLLGQGVAMPGRSALVATGTSVAIVRMESPRPEGSPAAQPVVQDRSAWARSIILRAIGEEGGLGLGGPRTERFPDGLLDELISDPFLVCPQATDGSIVVRTTATSVAWRAVAGRDALARDQLRFATIPAGPLSRRESSRRPAGLADLLLAAELCSFGAGLRAARPTVEKRRAGQTHAPITKGGSPFPRTRGNG